MTYEQYMGYMNAMSDFVYSDKSKEFKNSFFVDNMIKHIQDVHYAV
jgi:hypothetical protein